jgi:hypothetical protein
MQHLHAYFQNENKTKNSIFFPCELYTFNIDVHFKHQNTSCTLLKIVYMFQTWNFLNNKLFLKILFICMVKEKTLKL